MSRAARQYGCDAPTPAELWAGQHRRPHGHETFDPSRYDDPEAFRALVARDARDEASEVERVFLRDARTVQRWHDGLVALNKELEVRFSEKQAAADLKQQGCLKRGPAGKDEWFDYRARHKAWRAEANRFKSKVEAALSECKRLVQDRSEQSATRATSERRAYREALRSVHSFLSDEAAILSQYQDTRLELLRLVDDVLTEPEGQ